MGAPQGVDTTKPSPARVYDYVLGGTDNFEVDRAVADPILAHAPELRDLAADNRRFLERVVRHVVGDHGVTQILDIGSGLPTANNVHQVAQAIDQRTRVVYVDNDPTVHVQAQALIVGDENTRYVNGDVRTPERILNAPATQELIDFGRPVAVLFVSILQFVHDSDDPYGVVQHILSEVPSGSYVAIAHVTDHEIDPVVHAKIEEMYANVPSRFYFRDRDAFSRFFSGWDVLPPGITTVGDWTVDGAPPGERRPMNAWCGLARKP
ncbi:SAM-dependent methyltransferase [Streptosporangium sp. NPDC050855]|uniref:SAM-dependent methyltransferase n=1 Tax=Streptosporangium sp. NPDC050855 TaxID=3366194 RepID=UPI0037BB2C05